MNLPENGTKLTELFPGDTGQLPLDTRRVLALLLAGPSLDGRRHSKLWPALLRDEPVIRARLCELFLELVIDRDLQVAFTRRAEVGDLDAPVLLRSAQLTFIDSVLLLVKSTRSCNRCWPKSASCRSCAAGSILTSRLSGLR